MSAKLVDQFGNDVQSGNLYGIGQSEATLRVIETMYDHTRDEIMYRRRKTNDPWLDLYAEHGAMLPKHCVLLNEDLMPALNDPNASADKTIEDRVSAAERRVLALRADLQSIEHDLCEAMGVVVGDGSAISDAVMSFVYDSHESAATELLTAYRGHLLAGSVSAENCLA